MPARFRKGRETIPFNYPYSIDSIGHAQREIAVTLSAKSRSRYRETPVTLL